MSTREDFLALCRHFVGATGDTYAKLINAPGYETASGCALVIGRGFLPIFFANSPSWLIEPYRAGRAMGDLLNSGRSASAVRWPSETSRPCPGDIIRLAESPAGPEHVYVLGESIDDADAWHGIDGGQRDDKGRETVLEKRHEIAWVNGQLVDGGRPVANWIDLDQLEKAWGRKANG